MWTSKSEQLPGGRVERFAIQKDSSAVVYSEVLRLWQHDEGFRTFFNTLLADSPFSAFRWETPPITAASVGRPFEFVLIDSPGLAQIPDRKAFAAHFQSTNEEVVSFPNLGGDALLVVPCVHSRDCVYGHLAAFVRGAPESQRHALWSLVGQVMAEQLGTAPIWLSTAGAGVSWLHVRFDRRPKYYGHQPYRDDVKTS